MTTVPPGKYILLVDDDNITNFLHKSLIKDLNKGFEVVICENGLEALTFLEKAMGAGSFPQVILVDLNMPVVDGFKFLERYEQNNYYTLYADTRVTVLSTSSNPRDIQRLEQMHDISYMSKPLTKQRLVDLLNS